MECTTYLKHTVLQTAPPPGNMHQYKVKQTGQAELPGLLQNRTKGKEEKQSVNNDDNTTRTAGVTPVLGVHPTTLPGAQRRRSTPANSALSTPALTCVAGTTTFLSHR